MTGGIESFMDVTEMVKAREGIEEVNRRLEELATTDPLTGLWNRRHFVETLDAEIARSRRYGADLALLMVDVDQFKSINDSCGHLYGDRVLVEAARLLRNEARDNDIVARYAGDEFMVLMPNTTAEQAMNAAERVRAKAAERRISDERHTVRLTFSVGVAAIGPASDLPPEQIARAADEALYAAKHGGRNCIRMWSQVVDDPQADAELDGEAVKLLERKVEELSARSQDLFLDSLHGLVQALDARDPYMRCHSENVTRYAVAVARTMGLETEEVGVIRRAAMMHDIGKIGVPDAILQNTGPLSDQDRKVMRQHPLIGVRILSHMRVLEREIPLIRHHHERWNGEGYPDNIAGTAIPLGARILAVADAFDAITSDRVYRKGVGRPEAIERLVEQSGKQFDPVVVDALVQWLRSGADAPEETAAAGAPPGGLPNECLN
jgi:diguanylate cyclase (GGDEF)-like protein/putative nucleotidyltransferase with HDIG domain